MAWPFNSSFLFKAGREANQLSLSFFSARAISAFFRKKGDEEG